MYNVKVNEQGPFQVDLNREGRGLLNNEPVEVDIIRNGENSYHLLQKGKSFRIQVLKIDRVEKTMTIRMNGSRYEMILKDKFDTLIESMGLSGAMSGKINEFKAPMPGLVLDIYVQEGSHVSKGEPMIVLEAMKMENVLKAPGDGIVKSISVNKKQAVEKNQVLISFE